MNHPSAYDYSIRLLSKRDYSRYKLRVKLVQRGYEENEISEAIKFLEQKKFLREEEYLRIRVKSLLLNGHGNKTIRYRLEQEELYPDEEFIDNLRAENGLEAEAVLISLIEKKLRGKKVPLEEETRIKLESKILSHLVSKGHDYENAKSVLKGILNARSHS